MSPATIFSNKQWGIPLLLRSDMFASASVFRLHNLFEFDFCVLLFVNERRMRSFRNNDERQEVDNEATAQVIGM